MTTPAREYMFQLIIDMPQPIDAEQVKRAVSNSLPLTFKTYTLPHETEEYLEEVLIALLDPGPYAFGRYFRFH